MLAVCDPWSTVTPMDLDAAPATTVASARTPSEQERLWAVVSDPRLLPEFSDELESIRLVEPVASGAQFEGVNRRGDVTWTTVNLITTFEPGSAFGWTVGQIGHPGARWRFDIVDEGDERRLDFTCELLGGPSGLTWAIERDPEHAEELVAGRLAEIRGNMDRTVAGLCRAASGVQGSSAPAAP